MTLTGKDLAKWDFSKPTFINVYQPDQCLFCFMNHKPGDFVNIIGCCITICEKHNLERNDWGELTIKADK